METKMNFLAKSGRTRPGIELRNSLQRTEKFNTKTGTFILITLKITSTPYLIGLHYGMYELEPKGTDVFSFLALDGRQRTF